MSTIRVDLKHFWAMVAATAFVGASLGLVAQSAQPAPSTLTAAEQEVIRALLRQHPAARRQGMETDA